jgi:acyl carrier protein
MLSDKLKQTILKQLDLADFDLKDETLATEVPGWDSLSHVKILTAIEDAFGIRFRSLEVLRLRNVGELQALIDRKVGGAPAAK